MDPPIDCSTRKNSSSSPGDGKTSLQRAEGSERVGKSERTFGADRVRLAVLFVQASAAFLLLAYPIVLKVSLEDSLVDLCNLGVVLVP